jgi:hypothetical protein
MLSLLLASALMLAVPRPVQAQTSMRDLVGLQAAGFSDDLLIATFRSDGTVYYLTADELIFLRQQGVSERVLLAMLATRDNALPARPAVPAAPPMAEPAPSTLSPDPAPVVVNVTQEVTQEVEQRVEAPRVVHVPVVVPVRTRVNTRPRKAPEPVYWGFGGQRRPGTWEPSRTSTRSGGGGKTGGGGFER